jgi:hypothetical protein
MDAFDSALAITKANGSYSEIFAPELSSGARMSSSPLAVTRKSNLLFFYYYYYQPVFIPLDCAADPSLFPFPARTPGTLLDTVLSRGDIRSFQVDDVHQPHRTRLLNFFLTPLLNIYCLYNT